MRQRSAVGMRRDVRLGWRRRTCGGEVVAGAVVLAAAIWAGGLGSGCTHKVEVEVTRVAPIHMTLDVNLRVQRELEDVFDFRWKGRNSQATEAEQGAVKSELTAPGVPAPEEPGPVGQVAPMLPRR